MTEMKEVKAEVTATAEAETDPALTDLTDPAVTGMITETAAMAETTGVTAVTAVLMMTDHGGKTEVKDATITVSAAWTRIRTQPRLRVRKDKANLLHPSKSMTRLCLRIMNKAARNAIKTAVL